jgi:hypothetical protein
MKAIAIDGFGVPPSLHDLPVSEPGEGEVLVRVEASSVNGIDVAVADAYRKATAEPHFPVVLGRDLTSDFDLQVRCGGRAQGPRNPTMPPARLRRSQYGRVAPGGPGR